MSIKTCRRSRGATATPSKPNTRTGVPSVGTREYLWKVRYLTLLEICGNGSFTADHCARFSALEKI